MKGLLIKNERQKISISVEKKDAVTEEKLEGVIFGLYAKKISSPSRVRFL